MGCLFPHANNLTEFWRMLRRGEDGITDAPPSHWSISDYVAEYGTPDHLYCARGGFLDPVPFDPTEFGIPPTILEATDTSQLLGLVVAKAALEDAGYGDDREFNRERASVLLGVTGLQELSLPLASRLGHPTWRRALNAAGIDPDVAEDVVARIAAEYVEWQENSFPGLLGNVVAGRIANRLNLRGTNSVVDAACASSLGAAHLAMMELQTGRCDMAVTGGVDTLNDVFMYMCFCRTMAMSQRGDARPFDAQADGTVLGEGIGMLVLKRLEDAQRDGDRIYAVLAGVGTSSDGRSQSIYAPNAAGQARALRNAYKCANCTPDAVELIEAHGTGTKVGDVTEFEGLTSVFREGKSEGKWCALGSVKSQIGHAKAAAGAAGLIKAALAVYYRALPPTIKVDEPNPKLDIDDGPFYLNTELRPWISRDDLPRRAGVSAFGFGGSNFHAVIEEHRAAIAEPAWDGSTQLIALSADSVEGLIDGLDAWSAFAAGKDYTRQGLAWRAMQSREVFSSKHKHRLAIVVEFDADFAQLLEKTRAQLLQERGSDAWQLPFAFYGVGPAQGGVAFLFPGQGSQYVGMGREYACTFPEAIDALVEANAAASGERLSDLIFPAHAFSESEREQQTAALTRTENAQPTLGAISLGLLRVLHRFGVRPDMVAGHSYGELVALHAAGRYDAETLHRLSRLRGRLMAEGDGDRGTMLAVRAPVDDVAAMIEEQGLSVVLANRNAPQQAVLSGDRDAIAKAFKACESRGFAAKALRVAGAFHSRLMENAVRPLRNALEAVSFAPAQCPVYANTTASPYPQQAAEARELLARQLLNPVDFIGEVERMHAAGATCFIEVGPKAVLTGLVRSILADKPHTAMSLDMQTGRTPGLVDLAKVLAMLAAQGRDVDLRQWERAVREPRTPKMRVPLVGANYRSSKPTPKAIPLPRSPLPATIAATSEPASHKALASAEPQPTEATTPQPERETTEIQPVAALPPATPAQKDLPVTTEAHRDAEPPSQILSDALRLVREGLQAMQQLQQQTAEAHQRFLAGQEQAHRVFQQVLESQHRVLEQANGSAAGDEASHSVAPPTPPRVAPAAKPSTLASPAQPSQSRALPADVAPQAAPTPTVAAPPVEQSKSAASSPAPMPATQVTVAPKATETPKAVADAPSAPQSASADRTKIENVLLEVVCEKTGYPREMVDLDMDIEADLGVDSIKRVEIIAGVEERLPDWSGVNPEHMGGIRTLREIVSFVDVDASGGESSRTDGAATTTASAKAADAPVAPAADSGKFAAALLAVVSELTGYPSDMLDLGMDMEADLGIDSIKRVEILAALEARMPELPSVQPDHMGSLRTLQQIVEYCAPTGASTTDAAPAGIAPDASIAAKSTAALQTEPATETDNTPATSDKEETDIETRENDHVERRVLRVAELQAPKTASLGIAPDRTILVTDDGTPLASAIVAKLRSQGLIAEIVNIDDRQTPPSAPVGGLVIVAPPGTPAGLAWEPDAELFLRSAFAIAKTYARDLREAASKGGAVLATIARMDGAFGLLHKRYCPTHGGLAGLVKTAAIEWPNVVCRALDVAPTWSDAAATADAVVRELQSDGPIEVGLDASARRGLSLAEETTQLGKPAFAEGDVVVVTGGARGVTAECAMALATASKPIFVLLGRSTLPQAEPDYLAGLDEERAIKQAIAANEYADGERPKPAELRAAYRRRMADREIRENLLRIAECGARVEYRAVDVRDASAVVRLMDELRQTLGPIRGIIHAAGVLEDKRIEDKTLEQFDAVFSTKVAGLRNLLAAAHADDLKGIVLFSSVAGRFGNIGQADYAMANEVLNKAAQRLAADLPDCRVISINWGPWEGGMVTPPLQREFERRGIAMIGLKAGARAMVDELRHAEPMVVEVVLGAVLETPEPPKRTEAPVNSDRPMSAAFSRRIDLVSHPFLTSHVLDSRPVLPAAIVAEWLAHAALHANPGLRLHGIDDLRIFQGVVLKGDAVELSFATAKPTREGALFDVPARMCIAGATALNAGATIVLASSPQDAPTFALPHGLVERPYPRSMDSAYAGVLFHGEHFRAIESVEGFSAAGMIARVHAAPPPADWMHEPLRSNWIIDPLALDAAFQMAILWCDEEIGHVCLPSRVGRYRQYAAYPTAGLAIAMQVRKRARHSMTADFAMLDANNRLVAKLDDCEFTADAALRDAFRKRSLIAAT